MLPVDPALSEVSKTAQMVSKVWQFSFFVATPQEVNRFQRPECQTAHLAKINRVVQMYAKLVPKVDFVPFTTQ